MTDIRTLCYQCKEDYIRSGYTITSTGYQTVKSKCDKCERLGYEYEIHKINNNEVIKWDYQLKPL